MNPFFERINKMMFLFILIPFINFAQTTLNGKAIKIVDGDTFDLLVNEKFVHRIRLTDIDAPEKKQDFGNASKQQLAKYIFGKIVTVVYYKKDRNQRILGHVYCEKLYINLKMIEAGMAWHFKKYSSDARFAKAEIIAKKNKVGLWNQPKPIAPWDYRSSLVYKFSL